MSKTVSISPFILSPKSNKRHKQCSSDINDNTSINIIQTDKLSGNFAPNEKEINQIKAEFKQYSQDYGLFINELNFWKKILDKRFETFIKNIKDFMNNDDFKFAEDFDSESSSFNEFLRLKNIYYNIFEKTKNVNEVLYKPFLNVLDFSQVKRLLNELINSNDDINNMNKFISCSSKIINYIIGFNKRCQNISENASYLENNNKMCNINSFSDNNQRNKSKGLFQTNYAEKKIIEKFIDFKDSTNLNQRNKNLSLILQSSYNKTPNNFKKEFYANKKSVNNFESLKTSQSSCDILKTPKSHCQKSIYLRKSVTPIISESFCKNFKVENLLKKNESINLILNTTKTIEGKNYLNNESFKNNNIKLNKSLNFLELSTFKKKNSKTNEKKLEFSYKAKNIFNFNKNNFKNVKEKGQKTYFHKKMINSNNSTNNLKNNIELLSVKKHIKSNSNLIPNLNNEIPNFDNIFINKCKNFINNISRKDEIKSSIFHSLNHNNNIEQKEKEIENNYDKIKSNPIIIKAKYDDKILIDSNFPLYLGIDLGDNSCKLSMLNGRKNEIKLISFKKDSYSIPTIIYFDKKKEEIKIGHEAEILGIKEPSQIIFNLLKYIGINHDEINEKREILPFKIYQSDNKKRPFVKMDVNGQKGKLLYFEDILSLFLQKLFEELFDKIITKNPNIITINIILELSLPNYLSYLQKKIIEKIFYNQIFPKNITYKNYNINLMKINLEKSSNIAYLYNMIKSEDISERNILIIYMDKFSTNLSIVNFNKNIYEVKAIESAAFGEEEFNNSYLYYCLRNIGKKENIDYKKYNSFIYMLKGNISLAKKNFDIISKRLINLDLNNELDTIENNFDIILNKDDYEISCDELFKKITKLIKNIIDKSKLSMTNFDDIILIGQTPNSIKAKKILLDIFKENKKIIDKLKSNLYNKNIDSEYLIAFGCIIQSLNSYNLLKRKYFFIDICSSSLGVESVDGKMEIIIPKGRTIPCKNKKLIKINNKNGNICVNIYEGEDIYVKNNKIIISVNIDKFNLRKNIREDFIEIYIQLELDNDYNLKCFIHEPNSKNTYECLINIDVVKN